MKVQYIGFIPKALRTLYIFSLITCALSFISSASIFIGSYIPDLVCLSFPFSLSFFSLTSVYTLVYKTFGILLIEILSIVLLILCIINLSTRRTCCWIHRLLLIIYFLDLIHIGFVFIYFDLQYMTHIFLYIICGLTDIILISTILIFLKSVRQETLVSSKK